MADVNANIGINIDTSQSLAEIKALQRQLAQFYTSINKGSAAAAAAQKGLATNLMNAVNAGGKFYAQMGTIRTSTESFTHALEKNKLTMREYFRYAGGSTRTFGKLFKQEFDTIGRVAEERVKKMQTQYIKLGRDASGAMKAISITPTTLNMKDYGNQVAVAAQKQAILNQLLKQGSTNLLNFGKNTQWAGRQLMVGFTIPLAYFGTTAAKTFMDLEAQALKFRRVYGDMFTTTAETQKALTDIENLAKEFTKYGVAVSKTMEMAASAAAMGKTGAELTAQVAEATRLAVLGNVEQQQALDTTISLTNAFGLAAEDLTGKINFLNAVENQTVTAIEDLTIAIPKAGPVIQQLGGSVEDLAFFLTAMREGGINASEGANALKSGLASLINPTDKAAAMLADLGVNINAIVEKNKGNLREIVIDFAQALDTLAPLERSRAIEQLFGKFQFARLSTLFQNVTKEGTQAARVLDLAGKSVEELAILSERELKAVEDAVGTNFRAAVEELKLAIAPIGKEFLKAITPVVKFFGDLFEKFNNLSDGSKKFIVVLTTLIGLVGPTLLMTFGLIANGAANIIKLFLLMRQGFLKLTGNSTNLAQQTQYLNSEQMEAAVVAASLNQAHTKLTQQFILEAGAINQLRTAYINATAAAARFAATNPGMMVPGAGKVPKKFNAGTIKVPGYKKGTDSVPAMLTPGEAVIPEPIAQDERFKPLVQALVSGEIQGFQDGTDNVTAVKRKAIKQRFRKIYGKNASTRQSYIKNAANLDKLVDRLTYDPQTKTYSLTTKQGKVLTGITESKLFEKANYVFGKVPSQKGDFISEKKFGTPSNLERQLERVSKDGIRGTGAPTALLRLRDKSNIQFAGKGIDREVATLSEKLKSAGYSAKDIKNFTQSHLSHIMGGGDTATKWTRGQVLSDFQGLNQYIKGAGGPEVLRQIKDPRVMLPISQGGLGMSPRQVQLLLRDWAWAGNQKHPTSDTDFRRYARIAAFQEAASKAGMNVKNIGLVKGINALAAVRDPAFYKDVNERIIQLGDKARVGVSKAEMEKLTKDIKRGAVLKAREEFKVLANRNESIQNVATGKVRPVTGTKVDTSQITTPTGNKRDNILTTLKRGERIIQGVAAARTGRRLVLPGAQDAPVLSQAQVRAAQEGISLKEAKRREAADRKAAIATEKQTKQTEQTTKQTKTLGTKFATGANVFSGLTIAGSFMGGKVGEVSQKLAPLAIGLSTVAMLLPGLKSGILKFGAFLAANPFVAVGLAIAGIVVAAKILDEKMKAQARAQSEYIDAISATTEKMKRVGEVTGKVGASEIMSRRRESAGSDQFINKVGRAGQQFGTSFLESEVGKEILTNFQTNLVQGGSNAVKQIALELSSYVSDGLMTAENANSVARAIGINMSDMALAANIQGELRTVIGPNGEKLESEPLKVRLQIIEESRNTMQDYIQAARDAAFAGNESDVKKFTASAAAATAQSLESIQAQRDAQAKLTEDKIRDLEAQKAATTDTAKQAEIEQKILDLKQKQKDEDALLAKERAKTLKDSINYFKTIGGSRRMAFFESAKQQVKTKFKDDPFTENFLQAAKDLKNEDLEATLLFNVGSGDLSPKAAINFISMFSGDEAAMEAVINSKIAMENPDKFAQLQNLVGSLKGKNAKAVGVNIVTKLTTAGEEGKFEGRLQALTLLQQMDGKEIDVATYLEVDGEKKLDAISADLKSVQDMPTVTEKTVRAKLEELGVDEGGIKAFIADWEHYKDLPDEVQKTAVQTYLTIRRTITDENVGDVAKEEAAKRGLRGRSAAAFITANKDPDKLAASMTKTIIPAGTPKNTIPTGGDTGDSGGDKGRDTTLDNLLNRLKFVRKASINAAGGVQELLRITSGKGLTNFGGVMQQLMQGPSGGFNREFISFLEGMDNATRKTYMTVKNGQVVLTKQGKALKEAFNEKIIGDYQVAQVQALQDTRAQNAALIKLRAAGVDSATALEMVADANLAVAINSKDIDSKNLRQMAKDANDAKKEMEDLNLAVKLLAESLKKDVKDAGNTVLALSKARDAGIIDPEMLKSISQDIELVNQIVQKGLGDESVQAILKAKQALIELGDTTEGLINPAEKAMQTFQKLKDAAFKVFDRQERAAQTKFNTEMGRSVGSFESLAKLPERFKGLSLKDAMASAEKEIAGLEEKIQSIQDTKIKPIEIEIEAEENAIDEIMDALEKQSAGLAKGFKLPPAAYKDVADGLKRKIEDMELDLEFNKDYGARLVEQLQDDISKRELEIELNFSRPIAALQEESSDLSNDLTLMDRVADQINSKYDAQAEALKKVADVNQEILNQQKSQLDIAGALTQGDIAAAARAAQEARAQAASAASQRAGGVLDVARQAEIGSLRSAGGMTREQIEQRQFDIGQQIYRLEEQSEAKQAQILAIQDRIRGIEEIRIQKQREIRDIQDQLAAGERAREAFLRENVAPIEEKIKDLNKQKAGYAKQIQGYETQILDLKTKILDPLKKEADLIQQNLDNELDRIDAERKFWEDKQAALEEAITATDELAKSAGNAQAAFEAAKKAFDGIDSKTVTLTVERIFKDVGVGSSGPTGSSNISADDLHKGIMARANAAARSSGADNSAYNTAAFAGKMYGGKIKPMAYGGRIGSDFVPSLLTPGEFVVNKGATDAFLPLLSMLNESKYPSILAKRIKSYSMSDDYSGEKIRGLSAPTFYSPNNNVVSSNPVSTSLSTASIDNSSMVYNYNIGITVGGTNGTPNNIAKAVIDEIKYIDSQRVRGQRAI